jgi:hypothetical protein
MSRLDTYDLDLPATTILGPALNGAGVPLRTADYFEKEIQVVGLTGTADLEMSDDGVNYVKAITGIVNGKTVYDRTAVWTRLLRTGNGAGTVKLSGYGRSD